MVVCAAEDRRRTPSRGSSLFPIAGKKKEEREERESHVGPTCKWLSLGPAPPRHLSGGGYGWPGPATAAASRLSWRPALSARAAHCNSSFIHFSRKNAEDPDVMILFTARSLPVKPPQLFTHNSESAESKAHVFVSSSPFRWYHFHNIFTL
jgi:hypothetical protein